MAVADASTQRTTRGRDANDSLIKVEERAAPRNCCQIINVNAAEKLRSQTLVVGNLQGQHGVEEEGRFRRVLLHLRRRGTMTTSLQVMQLVHSHRLMKTSQL